MSQRATIFSKITTATGSLKTKAAYPDYLPEVAHSTTKLDGAELPEIFIRNFQSVNGLPMTCVDELSAYLLAQGHHHGYCDPALFDEIGATLAAAGLGVETEYDRQRYDAYQFGITRGTGAIAESGTVVLDDDSTSRRLAALSPWVHVAVIRPETIHRTITDALAALGDSPNVVWCTGPSKTADVEGILIEGVHGPGVQIALLMNQDPVISAP